MLTNRKPVSLSASDLERLKANMIHAERYAQAFAQASQTFPASVSNVIAVSAVAEAAVTEVLTRMIAEVESTNTNFAVSQWVWVEGEQMVVDQFPLADLIKRYFPTSAPTADEKGDADHD